MNLNHYQMRLNMWDDIVIKVNSPAKAILMDDENYIRYKKEQPFKYYGGSITDYTYRIQAPNTGSWHLIVEPESTIGFKHNIQIIRN